MSKRYSMPNSNSEDFSSIMILLYGSLSVDARVLREAKTLSDAGFLATVLDTELGFGRWTSYPGVRNHPMIEMRLFERTSIKCMVQYWYRSLRYLLAHRETIRVVHAHDLSALPPASVFKILCPHSKVIYDSHELFPEAAGAKMSFLHYVIFLGLELICSRFVDRLISVSPTIVRILSSRISAPASLIMNLPDLERHKPIRGRNPIWNGPRNDRKIRVAYSGIVLADRGYEKLLETAEILEDSFEVDCEFWIIGGGPFLDELKEMVTNRNLEGHFKFTDRVSFGELLCLTAECDIAVALYETALNNDAGLSNKLFEYMMIGMPFIFTNLIQSVPILKRVEALVVENPVSGSDFAHAIHSLYNDPDRMNRISHNGRRLVTTRLNWQRESQRFLGIYDDVLSKKK